jgi:hypothetical protein
MTTPFSTLFIPEEAENGDLVMIFSRVVAVCALSVDVNVLEKHAVCIFRAEDTNSMFSQNAGFYRLMYTPPQPGTS